MRKRARSLQSEAEVRGSFNERSVATLVAPAFDTARACIEGCDNW